MNSFVFWSFYWLSFLQYCVFAHYFAFFQPALIFFFDRSNVSTSTTFFQTFRCFEFLLIRSNQFSFYIQNPQNLIVLNVVGLWSGFFFYSLFSSFLVFVCFEWPWLCSPSINCCFDLTSDSFRFRPRNSRIKSNLIINSLGNFSLSFIFSRSRLWPYSGLVVVALVLTPPAHLLTSFCGTLRFIKMLHMTVRSHTWMPLIKRERLFAVTSSF